MRVWGTAWKVEIDTETLEDKISNDSEKVRANRSKRKTQIWPNEAPIDI